MRAAAVTWGMALSLIVSGPALAGPPVQRPGSAEAPTDQPGLDEMPSAELESPPSEVEPPTEVEPPPSEPAPAEIEPPPEVEPADVDPAPDAALPRYDAGLPPTGPADPAALPPSEWSDFDTAPPGPEPTPPTGRGRMAVGAILFGGSVVLAPVAFTMVMLTDDFAVGIPGIVVSGAAMTSGILLMATGAGRRNKYREWAEGYGGERAIPPQGAGLLAAGTTCMIAGPLGVLVGGVSLTLQDDDDLPYGQVLIPLGAVSIAGGVTMLVIGAKRKQKFQRWHREHVITPSFSLLPAGATRIGGASFGLAGRF